MKQNVLCAIDLDCYQQQLVDVAGFFARTLKTDLDIVYVTTVPEIVGQRFSGYSRSLAEILPNDQRLKAVRPTDATLKISHHHLLGMPCDELMRFVSENSPQLIVAGTHGRHGLTRLLLGSVAEYLLRHAPCPVVIVRQEGPARPLVTAKPSETGGSEIV